MICTVVADLRRVVENTEISRQEKNRWVLSKLKDVLTTASVQMDEADVTELKRELYRAGILDFCVRALRLSGGVHGEWTAATRLAEVLSSCCVGAEPEHDPEAFHRLLLSSVMDTFLSLACQLMRRGSECLHLFKRVMDSVGWLLQSYSQLTTQVLSSLQYEQMQMCDDVTVMLMSLWIHICTSNREVLSCLSEDSVMLLLNDAISQLAVSSDSTVGRTALQLVLLITTQQDAGGQLLHRFRGLDSLLNKDWKGRGFNQEIDQLITHLNSDGPPPSLTTAQVTSEHVQAAYVIQAAWRAHCTRRRIKTLPRAVSTIQRRYRAKKKLRQEQEVALRLEEELKYQVSVRRQRARRQFHQKQRELLQLLPPGLVQPYLSECERCAAVLIQKVWRGYRQRKRYNTKKHTHTLHRAARILQRAVLRFLRRRRAMKALPTPPLWTAEASLTDSRRAELKREVEDYTSLHPSSIVSEEGCSRLHDEVQRLLLQKLQSREEHRREEDHTQALLVQINTHLQILNDAPSLPVAMETDVELFQSRSVPIATRARQSHNAMLQASRDPWWGMLGDADDIISCPGPEDPTHLRLGQLFLGGEF
ncbi:IQ calmodulin-binding motif-containing protein 1 [Lampris incognitus]|uniref:IQ calmodulin-binding motif-containing protein 1 n=1 Tax=Lampris incognitus TaxID=2546036 RepID=UPI0024B505C5|nr:IQ calmodulin-binding motif-containing protein 1 [Lampris incognitus]